MLLLIIYSRFNWIKINTYKTHFDPAHSDHIKRILLQLQRLILLFPYTIGLTMWNILLKNDGEFCISTAHNKSISLNFRKRYLPVPISRYNYTKCFVVKTISGEGTSEVHGKIETGVN